MKLDVIVTRNGGHEDFFGIWVDTDDDIDVAEATIEHLTRAGVDT